MQSHVKRDNSRFPNLDPTYVDSPSTTIRSVRHSPGQDLFILLNTAKSQLLLRITTASPLIRTTAHSSISKTFYKLRFPTMNKSGLERPVYSVRDLMLAPQPLSLEPVQGQACKTVLETTELLALILAHLPAKTIIRVMRVSSAFKNCAQTSPEVLDRLWFRERRYRELKAPSEVTRTLLDPDLFCESYPKTRLTPVILNPYLCWDRTNVKDVRFALPFVNSHPRGNGWLPVAELLDVDRPQSCSGLILDTHFTYPVYNSMVVHLNIWFKKSTGETWGKFKLPPRVVFGSDASTPRSALASVIKGVHQGYAWLEEFRCHKVGRVNVQRFIEGTEERYNVKAVIDMNTTFELENAQVPATVDDVQ